MPLIPIILVSVVVGWAVNFKSYQRLPAPKLHPVKVERIDPNGANP